MSMRLAIPLIAAVVVVLGLTLLALVLLHAGPFHAHAWFLKRHPLHLAWFLKRAPLLH